MPQEPMSLEVAREPDGRVVMRLTGPLTLNNLFGFQAEVRSDAAPFLVIDLSGVPYIDSAGIGALVAAHVSRQKEGRKLVLVAVADRVRTALQVTQVEQFFTIVPTLDDAQRAAS
ncbi:MAG: STAS domain-containing protein [Terriglobales bacterium]